MRTETHKKPRVPASVLLRLSALGSDSANNVEPLIEVNRYRLITAIEHKRQWGLLMNNNHPHTNAITELIASVSLIPLLLISMPCHGNLQENIAPLATITEGLVDRLIELGKWFDYMVYPNRDHGLREGRGTSIHLRMLMARCLIEHLSPGPR